MSNTIKNTITDSNDIYSILNHLDDVEQGVEFFLNSNNCGFEARIEFNARDKTVYLLTAEPGFRNQCDIMVIYRNEKGRYQFKSKILKTELNHTGNARLRISPPSAISPLNRRKFFRVISSEKEPIYMELYSPNKKKHTFWVQDISGGGCSFYALNDQENLKVGTNFTINIKLPGTDIPHLKADIAIRNISYGYKVLRVGAEFINLEKMVQKKIIEYAIKHQLQMKEKVHPSNKKLISAKILIVDDPYSFKRYNILNDVCRPIRVRYSEALESIKRYTPELIIMNLDNVKGRVIFKAITHNNAALDRPMILLSQDDFDGIEQNEEVRTLAIPIKGSQLIEIVKKMICDYRFYAKVSELRRQDEFLKQVLLIDPHYQLDIASLDTLKDNGIDITIINSRHNIFEMAKEKKPDIILLGEALGRLIPSICKLMSLNPQLKNIPRYLLTEFTQEYSYLLEDGLINDCIPPPKKPDQFIETFHLL